MATTSLNAAAPLPDSTTAPALERWRDADVLLAQARPGTGSTQERPVLDLRPFQPARGGANNIVPFKVPFRASPPPSMPVVASFPGGQIISTQQAAFFQQGAFIFAVPKGADPADARNRTYTGPATGFSATALLRQTLMSVPADAPDSLVVWGKGMPRNLQLTLGEARRILARESDAADADQVRGGGRVLQDGEHRLTSMVIGILNETNRQENPPVAASAANRSSPANTRATAGRPAPRPAGNEGDAPRRSDAFAARVSAISPAPAPEPKMTTAERNTAAVAQAIGQIGSFRLGGQMPMLVSPDPNGRAFLADNIRFERGMGRTVLTFDVPIVVGGQRVNVPGAFAGTPKDVVRFRQEAMARGIVPGQTLSPLPQSAPAKRVAATGEVTSSKEPAPAPSSRVPNEIRDRSTAMSAIDAAGADLREIARAAGLSLGTSDPDIVRMQVTTAGPVPTVATDLRKAITFLEKAHAARDRMEGWTVGTSARTDPLLASARVFADAISARAGANVIGSSTGPGAASSPPATAPPGVTPPPSRPPEAPFPVTQPPSQPDLDAPSAPVETPRQPRAPGVDPARPTPNRRLDPTLPSRETALPGEVTQEDWEEYATRYPSIVEIVGQAGFDATQGDRNEAARALVRGAFGMDVVAWLRRGGMQGGPPPGGGPRVGAAAGDPDPGEALNIARFINANRAEDVAEMPRALRNTLQTYLGQALQKAAPQQEGLRAELQAAVRRLEELGQTGRAKQGAEPLDPVIQIGVSPTEGLLAGVQTTEQAQARIQELIEAGRLRQIAKGVDNVVFDILDELGNSTGKVLRAPVENEDDPANVSLEELRMTEAVHRLGIGPRIYASESFVTPIDSVNPTSKDLFGYIVIKKIEGKSIVELIKSGTLTDQQKRQISFRLAGVIAKLHAANIIHGDLHGGNFFITNENNVVLIDLGFGSKIKNTEITSRLLRADLTNVAYTVRELAPQKIDPDDWRDEVMKFYITSLEAYSSVDNTARKSHIMQIIRDSRLMPSQ